MERLGEDFSAFHAAECISCLPLGSALLSEIDSRASWAASDYMLHGIMQMLAGKEIPYPWTKKKSGIDGIETESLPIDKFKDWYENSKWKEVDSWQVQ